MEIEKTDKMKEKIIEISNLIFVLKMALLNNEQKYNDTLPYGRFVSMIEHKINSFYDMFERID